MTAVIEKYVAQYPSGFAIVSGGCPKGADSLAKEIALYLGIEYREFPPAHSGHNQHCVLGPEHYNKNYNVGNFFERNTKIAEYCDHVTAFVVEGVKANGTMDTVSKARGFGKPVVLFAD